MFFSMNMRVFSMNMRVVKSLNFEKKQEYLTMNNKMNKMIEDKNQ
jgi:hypothetical protein